MFFEFKGHKVFYEVDGKGKPLIITNGIMMSTKSWIYCLETMTPLFQVIRVDFFDQGQSDDYLDCPYNQDLQAELLLALRDHLGLEKASLFGVSYGGEVAIKFAIRYPERLEKLILCNTGAYTNPWLKDIGDGWNDIGATRNGTCYYNITIPVVYSPQFYDSQREWMDARKALLAPGVFSDPHFLGRMERLVHSSEALDERANVGKITAPTLIVTSEYDMLLPRPQQQFLRDHIPHNSWVVIPEAGHGFMYEDPELFITLVIGWMFSKREKI